MSKDEALNLAIKTNEWLKSHLWVDSLAGEELDKVTNACKEALEQDVTDINVGQIPQGIEWQGLTADELEDIKDNSKEGWYQLVRNVEQALKEKNT